MAYINVLGSGSVTLTGVVELTAGDAVGLVFVWTGLPILIYFGGSETPVFWSMHQIAD